MNKEFICYWDKRSYSRTYFKIVPEQFFNEERGYENQDIAKIKTLEVGQSHFADEDHLIIRLR